MSYIRGMGCIPDRLIDAERDASDRHIGHLVGASASYPDSIDFRKYLDAVPDQGATSRCVAWYVSSAVYLAGQVRGTPVPRPSAKWNYDVARYVDTPGVLVDIGSRCWSMLQGLGQHGMISEARLPSTNENVNEPPPFDADLYGADALLTGYYKLEGRLSTLIRMTLAAGHLPGFAMVVHESFQDLARGELYDEPDGMELGRHMVTCIGYRPGAILLLNSWGRFWADDGFCWVSDRFVDSHYVFDRYAITAAPRIVA